MLNGTTDYWALLGALNLSSAYKPRNQPYSLATHGSHTVNGVQLIPGAPGYDPQLAYGQWVALLTGGPPAPEPTISVSGDAAGFTITLNVAGTVSLPISGALGSFAAGNTVLSEQTTLKQGFLTLAANGNTSAATSQYVVLGTSGDDSVDFSALAASRVDYIFGGAGNDTLKGGAGDDVIVGGTGNDTIYGNEDDDLFYGGEGNDNLTGSVGADTFNVDAGTDTVTDLSGSDVLVVSAGAIANASVTAHFIATAATSNAGVANLKLADGVNADLSLATGPVGYNITADRNASASRIVGSEFADDIYGGNVNDTIIAGAGDDIIRGGAGADTIDTGTGTNTIIVGGSGAIAGGESYTGGGTDTLSVTGTTVFGGVTIIDSIETILLAAGITATFEAAALTGDTIAVNGTGDNGQESLIVRGTIGNDTINLGGLTLDTNDISGATIDGLDGDDTITGTNGGDTIVGGAGTDILLGGDDDDKFRYLQSGDLGSGAGVIDSVDGGAGTNTLVVGNNTGTQSSFQIVDTMSWARITNVSRIEAVGAFVAQFNLDLSNDAYEAGLRVIDLSTDTNGGGNINLIDVSAESGSTNGYTLIGSVGVDSITGGAGSDTITGGAGVDNLQGGGGNDIFIVAAGQHSGTETISGGAETDVIRFTSTTAQTLTLSANVNVEEVRIAAADGTATGVTNEGINAANVGNTVLIGLYGNAGDNVLVGNDAANTLQGGAGADRLTGRGGADAIALGAGDGATDSVIYTAAGETATGVFTSGGSTAGMDAISEAALGDVIDLWDVFSAAPTLSTTFLTTVTANQVAIVQGTLDTAAGTFTTAADNDYLVQWSDGSAIHSIVLKDYGTTAPTLTTDVANDTLKLTRLYNVITGTAGDDNLVGTAGDDMIIGAAGKDTMNGGDGDDIFIIASAADHGNTNNGEQIYGGDGVDAIWFTSTTPNESLNLSYWTDVEEVRIVAADGSENLTAGLGINAAWLGVGPNIKLYGNAGNNSLVGNDDGSNTIEGGAGNDVIRGGWRSDVLIGGTGVDEIYLGSSDVFADTVRADEGDGQMLVAGEIAHLASDRIEQFNATHDKFVVSGAGTSVILNGAAATQTAGTAFQNVTTGTFDLNGAIGGAYITGAAVGNLRAFNDVKAAIGALANESVGEEAYFVLRDGGGAGNAGVYHFRSVTANNQVDVGEIELLGLVLTGAGSNLTGLGAGNFLFA